MGRVVRTLPVLAWTLLGAGCAPGAIRQLPDIGKITVGVTTTGLATSPGTFKVTIEPAGITGEVKADAGVFVNDSVPAGDHVVRLLVPSNCRVDAGTERPIAISPQRKNAVVRFNVRCS
jgi:hypothetical protein